MQKNSISKKYFKAVKWETFCQLQRKLRELILIKQQDVLETDALVSIRKVNQLKKQKINSATIKVPL